MNIEVTKYELMNQLLNTTDEHVLQELISVFKKMRNKNEKVTIAQYNTELKAAEDRISNGKFTSHDDLELESEKW